MQKIILECMGVEEVVSGVWLFGFSAGYIVCFVVTVAWLRVRKMRIYTAEELDVVRLGRGVR